MNQEQASYNRVMVWIDESKTHFDLRGGEILVDLFGKHFPEAKGAKHNLIDLLNDKIGELFKTNTNVKP